MGPGSFDKIGEFERVDRDGRPVLWDVTCDMILADANYYGDSGWRFIVITDHGPDYKTQPGFATAEDAVEAAAYLLESIGWTEA